MVPTTTSSLNSSTTTAQSCAFSTLKGSKLRSSIGLITIFTSLCRSSTVFGFSVTVISSGINIFWSSSATYSFTRTYHKAFFLIFFLPLNTLLLNFSFKKYQPLREWPVCAMISTSNISIWDTEKTTATIYKPSTSVAITDNTQLLVFFTPLYIQFIDCPYC